jgi:hypothetical protein
MWRKPNTTISGEPFGLQMIEAVWAKGMPIVGFDPGQYRKDKCGAWMQRNLYGSTSQFGWEIDHIRPVSAGGGDALSNLEPLQWQNNRGKGDDYPQWSCSISAA